MSISLNISLKRANKIYNEGETICGAVIVESASDFRHEGIQLVMEGSVSLQLSSKNAGLFENFSNTAKEVPLIKSSMEIAEAGRLPAGVTRIPFEMGLGPRGGTGGPLPESYHGVFVSVMYALRCTLRRPFLAKPLHASCQFFVQQVPQEAPPTKPVRCEIGAGAGRLLAYGELDSAVCPLDRPITGKIRIEETGVGARLRSVELQLVRVESVAATHGRGDTRDATEVQNIEVACGDVARGRDVPLYVVLPRLFTCPTLAARTTPAFSIEFELNIAVIFEDDFLVTENIPILLVRSKC